MPDSVVAKESVMSLVDESEVTVCCDFEVRDVSGYKSIETADVRNVPVANTWSVRECRHVVCLVCGDS